jgi:hypothetical protein
MVHADRIYFLDGGRISASGNHDELLADHPHYARPVARQFRNVSRARSATRERPNFARLVVWTSHDDRGASKSLGIDAVYSE